MHKKTKEQLLHEAEGRPVDQAVIEEISEPGFEFLPKITSRRFIKTHLPLCLLPPSVFQVNAKIVYVARNPLDVVVSYYHLNKLWKTQGYQRDFEQFYNYFERNLSEFFWFAQRNNIKRIVSLDCSRLVTVLETRENRLEPAVR
jgi:sulfotransferase